MRIIITIALILITTLLAGGVAVSVRADTATELREKISERNTEIEEIEEEIEQYQEQLFGIRQEAQTLDNAIKELELTEQKLSADIRLTSRRITATTLIIDQISKEILEKEKNINRDAEVLAETIRNIHDLESRSLVEIILAHNSFSAFWGVIADLASFQGGVRENLKTLRVLKKESQERKQNLEIEKQRLLGLRQQLTDQQEIVAANKRAKDLLLRETKNKESNYENLLAERLAQKKALEREILEFEAQLKVEIDPESLPPTGTGILSWPLKNVHITQYFGNTKFASKNPQVYNSSGHNGIDLRAPVGTIVTTPLRGVVSDTGNTDTADQCPGASYGKWVLIRHGNGLSTLYAHLSLIRVTPGQELERGDLVGYSGNSGYSTGPHLHLGLFATKAVRVTNEYTSRVCGTNLKLPLSPQNGYLNPLSYLQELP